LNGEKLSFNDLIGKTVVINWWATTCGPCIAEMPGFNKLVEQYKENPNVIFIAIAHDKKERVTKFLENKEFNYVQTMANEEALRIFGNGYPVNVILNSAGKICHYSTGGHPDRYLEIERIIEKNR
jgi:thiol-disulfide isomerase/thioredoxin